MSVDTRNIVMSLTRNYYPFNLLSPRRAREAFEAVRVFELREGESLTITGGKGRDYLYLIEGEIEIEHDLEEANSVRAEDTRRKPLFLPPLPYKTDIRPGSRSIICHADSNMFDFLLLWDELTATLEEGDEETRRRIELVNNTLALQDLKLESLAEAFRRMGRMEVEKGEEICAKGEPGAMYYILEEGEAEAFDGAVKLTDLSPGDIFGVMASVEESICGATVRMKKDGSLLALFREDYDELMATAMVEEVGSEEAREKLGEGWKMIDVRYEMEREESRIPDSIFIPLHDLRKKMGELEKEEKYVVYCRSGKRSRAAAHMMGKTGLKAVSMRGGILGWPFDIEGETY